MQLRINCNRGAEKTLGEGRLHEETGAAGRFAIRREGMISVGGYVRYVEKKSRIKAIRHRFNYSNLFISLFYEFHEKVQRFKTVDVECCDK